MNYSDLISYFKLLAAGHRDINGFVTGDDEAILKLEKNQMKYPCLVLETPTAKPTGDMDSHQLDWDISFTVLINATDGNTGRQEANLVTSFNITQSILLRLKNDAAEGVFKSINLSTTRSERVYSLHNDNDQGWRTETSVSARPPRYCIDSNLWDDNIEYLSIPSFSIIPQPILKAGSTRSLNIDLINFINEYTGKYVIRYTTDGKTWTTPSTLSGIEIDVDDQIYVELTITFDDIVYELSAFNQDADTSVTSIPFLNNPF